MDQLPVFAESVPAIEGKTIYPEPFASRVKGRTKRKLGNYFGLTNFGVNLTSLTPGSVTALLHHHSKQDEFIYILEGTATLVLGKEEHLMNAGDCFGVKAGTGIACQLINKSNDIVTLLEIGDRSLGDEVEYPNDDLKVVLSETGEWKVTHKDGSPY
ncbi:MAG: cupin domain-containing protein [Gammaproteobacteria bacterium]